MVKSELNFRVECLHNSMLEREIRLKMWKISGFCRNNIKAIQVISHARKHIKISYQYLFSLSSIPSTLVCSMLCNFSIRLIEFQVEKESATAMEQSFLVILSAMDVTAKKLLLLAARLDCL